MSQILTKRFICGFLISFALSLNASAYADTPQHDNLKAAVSANVPLDSTVYGMLGKLDALGYLEEMRPSTKPYTRMQVAQWVQQINANVKNRADLPPYAQSMLQELNREFAHELKLLSGETSSDSVKLREISFAETYYDGNSLSQSRTESTYQPLNINNNGYRYEQNANEALKLRFEGNVSRDLAVSITPRIANNQDHDISLESGYLKTHLGNLAIQVGKDPMWWGPGVRGSMVLTNNAPAISGVKLSTIEPIRARGLFRALGDVHFNSFYGELDGRTDVTRPSFFGMRTDSVPGSNLTIGASLTAIMGGVGHELSSDDYWDFIIGENADTTGADKWNTIAGFDIRLRLPQLKGLELYGEVYGEDQDKAAGLLPLPSHIFGLVGVYIPRLTPDGTWDAALEWGRTNRSAYGHSLYTDGYVYDGNLIGDAQGNNANRYYARLTHYHQNATSTSLHLEHMQQNASSPSAQQMDSIWISAGNKLCEDTTINISAGLSRIKNANGTAGKDETNHLVSVTLVKKM